MIPLFDIENEVVVPTTACHVIPQLKVIMDLFPDDYLEIYKYIFFLTCPDATLNVYYNRPEDTREQEIIADLKPKFYIDDMKIQEAIAKCRQLYETPTLRAAIGAKKMYDRVASYLADSEITDGKDGNAGTVDKYMKSLEDYRKTYLTMEKALQEEQVKIRGDGYRRYDTVSGYKSITADDSTEKEAI